MWLVAHIAGGSARMLCRNDLRKLLRFGDVRFVTTGTKHGGLQFRRFYRARIFRMLCLCTMARLTVDSRMLAFLLYFEHVGVAHLARLVTRKGESDAQRFRRLRHPDNGRIAQSCAGLGSLATTRTGLYLPGRPRRAATGVLYL